MGNECCNEDNHARKLQPVASQNAGYGKNSGLYNQYQQQDPKNMGMSFGPSATYKQRSIFGEEENQPAIKVSQGPSKVMADPALKTSTALSEASKPAVSNFTSKPPQTPRGGSFSPAGHPSILLNPSDGSIYAGEHKDGSKQGFGALKLKEGASFKGSFEAKKLGFHNQDQQEGFGQLEQPDGSVFEGSFKGGKPHGYGIYLTGEGGRQEGTFTKEGLEGQGAEFHPNFLEYKGGYSRGVKNGHGTMVFPNGDKYVGEFQNGALHGKGTYFYNNGDKFNGIFNNNLRDGQGTLEKNDGSMIKTTWKDDKKEGPGVIVDALDDFVSKKVCFTDDFLDDEDEEKLMKKH